LIKRVAFGFRKFRDYRVRALLYAGKPNSELLATITPRQFPMSDNSRAAQRDSLIFILPDSSRFTLGDGIILQWTLN
jgi:hypothetical protein